MSTALLMRGLYGEPKPETALGQALWLCRRERAMRDWFRPGSYGWWRYTDSLKNAQRRLLALRPPNPTRICGFD